jgi:hypothetical protein
MRLDEEEHVAGRKAGRWRDVKQAAEELGISSDAVRKRIARETLRSSKQEDGSVRVWLDGVDDQLDEDQPNSWTEAGHRLDELINAKDDALRDLRDQLEHMRRESERKDAIIMQMAQANAVLAARVPELEAASELRESSDTVAAPTEEEESSTTPEGPEEPSERRERSPWWRRWFGG